MSTKISEEIIQFFVTNNMNYFLGIFNKDRILTVHNNTLDHKKESSIDEKKNFMPQLNKQILNNLLAVFQDFLQFLRKSRLAYR